MLFVQIFEGYKMYSLGSNAQPSAGKIRWEH